MPHSTDRIDTGAYLDPTRPCTHGKAHDQNLEVQALRTDPYARWSNKDLGVPIETLRNNAGADLSGRTAVIEGRAQSLQNAWTATAGVPRSANELAAVAAELPPLPQSLRDPRVPSSGRGKEPAHSEGT